MKIEINCSQELLEKSKYCGTGTEKLIAAHNCWIALAVQEVFPVSRVTETRAEIFFGKERRGEHLILSLPESARTMIKLFDGCLNVYGTHETAAAKRLRTLAPFTFEIELTEEQVGVLLENISLPELTECFEKSRHLTLTA